MCKKNRKINFRVVISSVLLCLVLVLFCGCSEKGKEVESFTTVFEFQGKSISLGEVYLYARTVMDDYEKTYGQEVWSMKVAVDDEKTDLRTLTRKDIIEDIVKVKVLCGKAESYGVSLMDSDHSRAEIETEAFWKNLTDVQIREMELTRDMVKQCITENILAGKVYDKVMEEAGIEVSDEEGRMTTIYDMYFPCYRESATGAVTPMSADEKADQYEKALQAYNTLINPVDDSANRNVEALASYYGLTEAGFVTKSPEELKLTYGSEITNMLYTLEDGSYSLVTETEYGYHIFYMQSLTDRTATNRKKDRIERERKNLYFTSRFAGWLKEADSSYEYEKSVDFEVYDKIAIQ